MGKKKLRAVRTTTSVSVPADLRKRMLASKEVVNWSQVACEAFERKLGELAEQRLKSKRSEAMSDVVERLRASLGESRNEMHEAGLDLGQEWAKTMASAKDLKRLQQFMDCYEHETYAWTDGSSAYSNAERLAFAILGKADDDWDRQDASDFWDGWSEHELSDDDYLNGFIEGALEVWNSVKNEL